MVAGSLRWLLFRLLSPFEHVLEGGQRGKASSRPCDASSGTVDCCRGWWRVQRDNCGTREKHHTDTLTGGDVRTSKVDTKCSLSLFPTGYQFWRYSFLRAYFPDFSFIHTLHLLSCFLFHSLFWCFPGLASATVRVDSVRGWVVGWGRGKLSFSSLRQLRVRRNANHG